MSATSFESWHVPMEADASRSSWEPGRVFQQMSRQVKCPEACPAASSVYCERVFNVADRSEGACYISSIQLIPGTDKNHLTFAFRLA